MNIAERVGAVLLSAALFAFACATAVLTSTTTPRLARFRANLKDSIVDSDSAILAAARRNLATHDLPAAHRLFQLALYRDSSSAFDWAELGGVLLEQGQTEKARYCFFRAVQLGPDCPPVLMRAVRAFTRLGDHRQVLTLGARELSLTDQYDQELFGLYETLKLPAEKTVETGVPPNRRAVAAYLRYLLWESDADALASIWKYFASRALIDDALANDYVAYLLKRGEYSRAAIVWNEQLGARSGSQSKRYNLLNNGDFEFVPTEGILDWAVTPIAGVQVTRDNGIAHSGNSSLRIQFEGTANPYFHHANQTVVVPPGRYVFEAYVRTENLSTDQGIGFRIFDTELPSRLDINTRTVTATVDWTRIERAFVVPLATSLISVQVVRQSSARFFGNIGGTAWVDSVSITPEPRENASGT